ncbi:MAG TPA: DEAD/DEAH box helicase [Candidatus Aenigmarchaeota archaeon]|nr:DEAD/DEAH box helicase [Candidatus Aenigmarchaeota archaeon]
MEARLKLYDYSKLKPRLYQETIAATAIKRNTLVVLPTGLGKTLIAVLVAAYRLQKYPKSKILMMAPTRPLCAQHQKTFKKLLKIDDEKIILVTGKIKPEKRKLLYKDATIVISTPQCIQNDLKRGILKLTNFSLAIFDESHRCVKDYAYTFVAKKYVEQSLYPLILGLTASPGGKIERISEIKRNLKIEAVEIRSETDKDVAPYVQKTKREWVYVELPEEFKKIRELLNEALNERISVLKEKNLLNKDAKMKDLIKLSNKLAEVYYEKGNRNAGFALSVTAEAIKIDHAIDLLETQGIKPLFDYFTRLSKDTSRTTKRMLNDPRVIKAVALTKELYEKGFIHPKMKKLLSIVKDLIKLNRNVRIIVFANYRATINEILKKFKENGIDARKLVGQAKKSIDKGLKQREQIAIINEFNLGLFNVLVCSSIGEEGLSINAVDYVIFYENVPSEIRRIQRRGRTGRTAPGKVIFLITKGTRDEAYYWASFHREKKMKKILYSMREKNRIKTLLDWLR